MKKIFTILTIFALTTTVSFAQFSAKAGLNMANISSNDDDAENAMKLGMIIGGNYAIEISDVISFDISAIFKQSGTKETYDFEGGSNSTIWSLNYIDISPNLAFNVSDAMAFSVGPYIAFAISGEVASNMTITNGPTTETSQAIKFGDGAEDDGIKAMDFGVNIGATFSINDAMSVSAGYSLGLNNLIYIDDEDQEFFDSIGEDAPSAKNSGIFLSFGYSFGG